MTDLHPGAGGNQRSSSAERVNDAGLIAGSGEILPNDYGEYATVWENGVARKVSPGSYAFYLPPQARAMNAAGDVLFWTSSEHMSEDGHTSLWSNGNWQDLGLRVFGNAINNSGTIVGGYAFSYYRGESVGHAFRWDNGVHDLGGLSDTAFDAEAFDINNQGDIVGRSSRDGASYWGSYPVMWHNDSIQQLADFTGQAIDINNRGQILINRYAYTDFAGAYLWDHGALIDLGSLGGGQTNARALNDLGQIVGCSNAGAGVFQAFIWENGVMTDLGAGSSGGDASLAVAINERGDVLGRTGPAGSVFRCDTGWQRGTLWRRITPPPPPPPPPIVTTVRVSPSTAALDAIGATTTFTAQAYDQNGNPMTGQTFTWTSDNARVGSIDSTGTAIAAGNGTATISATTAGVTGTTTLTVNQRVATVSVSPASIALAMQQSQVLTAAARDPNNNPVMRPVTFSWSTSDAVAVPVTVNPGDGSTATVQRKRPQLVVTITVMVEGTAGTASVQWADENP